MCTHDIKCGERLPRIRHKAVIRVKLGMKGYGIRVKEDYMKTMMFGMI